MNGYRFFVLREKPMVGRVLFLIGLYVCLTSQSVWAHHVPFEVEDVFVSVSNGQVQHRDAAGTSDATLSLKLQASYSEGQGTRVTSSKGPASAGWKVPFDGSESSPVIEDGVLYIGSFDGAVYAFEARTGRQKWHFQTGKGLISGPEIIIAPSNKFEDMLGVAIDAALEGRKKGKREIVATAVVKEGTVYIGSKDHSFYALDAETGKLEWSFTTGGVIFDQAIVENGIVYFGSGDGFVYALNASDGQKKWAFDTLPDMHEFANRHPKEPATRDGVVYVTNWPAHQMDAPHKSYLYAIDAESGTAKWVFSMDGNGVTKAATSGDLVFFSAYTEEPQMARLHAIGAESGILKWDFKTKSRLTGFSPPIVGDDLVYFATDEGVFAVEQDTGKLRWRFEGEVAARNLHLDQVLYIVKKNKLYALDPITGKQRWSARVGGWIEAVIGGVVYVSSGESLVAVDNVTGKKLWKFKTGGFLKQGTSLSSGPTEFENRLFFSTGTELIWGREPIQGHLYSINATTGKR